MLCIIEKLCTPASPLLGNGVLALGVLKVKKNTKNFSQNEKKRYFFFVLFLESHMVRKVHSSRVLRRSVAGLCGDASHRTT